MPKIELQISALPTHVRTARLVAAALGRRIGLDTVVIDEVKFAVGEACSRAVGVHRKAAVDEPIVIQFCDDDGVLEVSVADCGPAGAQPPSPATIGGQGAGGVSSDAAHAAAADLLRSAASSAQEPADLERRVDVSTLAPSLGLAMIAGLVDDFSFAARSEPGGAVVTMRWPIAAR